MHLAEYFFLLFTLGPAFVFGICKRCKLYSQADCFCLTLLFLSSKKNKTLVTVPEKGSPKRPSLWSSNDLQPWAHLLSLPVRLAFFLFFSFQLCWHSWLSLISIIAYSLWEDHAGLGYYTQALGSTDWGQSHCSTTSSVATCPILQVNLVLTCSVATVNYSTYLLLSPSMKWGY